MGKLSFIVFFLMIESQLTAFEQEKLPWLRSRHVHFVKQVEQAKHLISYYPTHHFPVNQRSKIFSSGKILIFGYGSLLNRESASRTLSKESMQTYQPVIAFGLRRVFDRHVPTSTHWGVKKHPNDTAMLNIHKVSSKEEIVNGVVFEVNQSDLKNLLKREEGYDLIPVLVMRWEEVMDRSNQCPELFVAYTFAASKELRTGKHYTKTGIYPVPGYYFASKKGAEEFGQEFLQLWLETTYLSDGKTPVIKWEKSAVRR